MESSESRDSEKERSELVSWLVIGTITAWIFIWALFLFFTVESRWPPGWDYRIIEDVPAASPYSTESRERFFRGAPTPRAGQVRGLPQAQHVDGQGKTEFQQTQTPSLEVK